MCDRINCTAEPEWRPVLILRSPSWTRPARAVMGVRLCGFCRYRLRLEDVLLDAGWAQLTRELEEAGIAPPERALTRLDFCRLRSAESRRFDVMRPS